MELLEIFSDEQGETHFRRVKIETQRKDFAPPSMPLDVSAEAPVTTSVFLAAQPGWDPEFHATPRKQYALLLRGRVSVTASDGETVEVGSGSAVLLNDQDSKGHRTMVLDGEEAVFFLVGLAEG